MECSAGNCSCAQQLENPLAGLSPLALNTVINQSLRWTFPLIYCPPSTFSRASVLASYESSMMLRIFR